MTRARRRLAAGTLAGLAALVVLAPACGDQDGDGATTDEEIGDIQEKVEEGTKEAEQRLEEGRDRLEQELQQGRDGSGQDGGSG